MVCHGQSLSPVPCLRESVEVEGDMRLLHALARKCVWFQNMELTLCFRCVCGRGMKCRARGGRASSLLPGPRCVAGPDAPFGRTQSQGVRAEIAGQKSRESVTRA